MVKIIYVDYGIANRYDDTIELNKNLQLYKELHDGILEHELAHTNKPGFTKEDFILDIGYSKISYWKLLKFMCIYPKSFFQFFPFYFNKGVFFYDINMIISWAAIFGIIGLALFFGLR